MEDKRKWYRLTLPGTTAWNAFSHPMTAGGDLALDPLRVWPDAWTPSVQNPAWERAMTWDHLDGFHAGMLSDVGIKQYAVNYAFNDLYEYIPSGCNDFNMLRFDVRPSSKNAVIDHLTKQKNFYGALQYLQQYPERDRFQSVLGYSPKYHDRLIQPTIYSTAQSLPSTPAYHLRNEHLVALVKDGRHAFDTRWRGSVGSLAAAFRLVSHIVTLQDAMDGPRYDCYGPWPVCPDDIAS